MPALDDKYFYKHSGKTGFSIPLILLIGVPVSAMLAAIYALVCVYCPIVGWVNILFLGAYIFGTATVIGMLAETGKCRNEGVLFLLGCLAGLIGLYFSWVFSMKAFAMMAEQEISVLALVLNPGVLWAMIVEINKEGWWGPSGFFQWLLCAIEAIGFVGGVGLLSWASINRVVFCEDCGTWCKKSTEQHLEITEAYAESLEGDDDEFNHLEILKLPETTEDSFPRFTAEILKCTGCEMTSAVRIELVEQKETKDGPEVESTDIDGILLRKTSSVS